LNYHLWLPSHLAVMVFFVLSGCVIAYTTFQRHPGDVQKYIIARLSRLYSVVIPALILTGILFFMGGFD
jgi:peptidoglycan/LPS O-acetylase OafA/YrhL